MYQESITHPWLILVFRGLECSCMKSRGAEEAGVAVATTGVPGAKTGSRGAGTGGGTATGEVGRTTPLLRVTDTPVNRTDTGDFGSSSVNKRPRQRLISKTSSGRRPACQICVNYSSALAVRGGKVPGEHADVRAQKRLRSERSLQK